MLMVTFKAKKKKQKTMRRTIRSLERVRKFRALKTSREKTKEKMGSGGKRDVTRLEGCGASRKNFTTLKFISFLKIRNKSKELIK